MKSFIPGFFLVLISFSLLNAQTATNAPADTNAVAANVVPAGQAPDDVVKKLSGLVHDGKYAEAQQLTVGLLLAYPDDQRLIKAKTLLDKLIATTNSSQPTNSVAQPAASGASEQLTGMAKVDYNALLQRARDAQQTTDLDQQKILLKQFMADSSQFLQKHPDQMTLWEFRVASALILNDPDAGYEAGQKLLATGAADSNDPKVQQLLAQLKNKGWLDKEKVDEIKKEQDDATAVAVINTTDGEMIVEFWPDVAPNTVANFKKLARSGFYDGTAFHRVIKGFMIQGGDPLTKDPSAEDRWGTGGPGYAIQAELNDRPHIFGVLSMARGADLDSGGSQFFICDGDAPSLNHQYAAFGKLIKGDDVLTKIATTRTHSPDRPNKRIGVISIKIVPRSSIE